MDETHTHYGYGKNSLCNPHKSCSAVRAVSIEALQEKKKYQIPT